MLAGGSRVRYEGPVFHVGAFVVPRVDAVVSLLALEHAAAVLRRLDWKLRDVVVIPVRNLPVDIERGH